VVKRNINARRGDCDSLEIPGWAPEVKRVESWTEAYWAQAVDQAERLGRKPVLFYRGSRRPWVAMVDLADVAPSLPRGHRIEMSLEAFADLAASIDATRHLGAAGDAHRPRLAEALQRPSGDALMRSPSQILEDLAALVGWDAVATLVRMAGGQSRKIPLHASDEHWLTTFIGTGEGDALCKRYGGDTLWIPKNDGGVRELRDSQIRAMRRGGRRPSTRWRPSSGSPTARSTTSSPRRRRRADALYRREDSRRRDRHREACQAAPALLRLLPAHLGRLPLRPRDRAGQDLRRPDV
jgi:hypothetical protein